MPHKNEYQELKKRSLTGVVALFLQSGAIQVMGFFANLALTILLAPNVFGLYFTVLAIIAFLNYFSDIGLAASLIQKKEVDDKDLASAFTVQQTLTIVLCTVLFFLTPHVMNFYNLPSEAMWLYFALILSFFISSLKTIPSILLERNINFTPLSIVQVLENLVFYICVASLAASGWGIWSFTVSTLVRAITGLVGIYIASPWKIKLGIHKKRLKEMLSYGVPFQANSFLALLKDDLITLYLGKILGFTQLGYVGWAKKWSAAPQQLIMSNFIRVSFPTFSRLKDDKEKLGATVEKFLYYMTLVTFPALVGMIFILPYFIALIPKYSKWEPALFSLVIFCISALFSSVVTPLTNLLNAIGKVKLSLLAMVIWTILTWGSIPFFVKMYSYNGVSLSILFISVTSLFVVFLTKKYVSFSFVKPLVLPSAATALMAVALQGITYLRVSPIMGFVYTLITGIVSYAVAVIILSRGAIIRQTTDMLHLLKARD